MSAIRDSLDTGDPFLAAAVTRGPRWWGWPISGVGPGPAKTALEWLYPTCAVEGCSAVTWLENDHRADWAKTGFTVLDLLDRLRTHHHDLKSLDGWALVPGHGKRAFVRPDDRRHPAHSSSSAA